jgi:hypothetical protein
MTIDRESRMWLRPRLAVTSSIAITTALPASSGGVPLSVNHDRALSPIGWPNRLSTTSDA